MRQATLLYSPRIGRCRPGTCSHPGCRARTARCTTQSSAVQNEGGMGAQWSAAGGVVQAESTPWEPGLVQTYRLARTKA